jgi:pimeloyl-ACP methyl ester carboxylesterase
MGHSAGGHLCLYAGVANSTSTLIGAVALAPAADLQMAEKMKLGEGATAAFLGVSAAERADLDPARMASPTIDATIVHGLADAIVPVALAESYVAKHPATRLTKLDGCGHFAVIDPLSTAWPTVIHELRRFT